MACTCVRVPARRWGARRLAVRAQPYVLTLHVPYTKASDLQASRQHVAQQQQQQAAATSARSGAAHHGGSAPAPSSDCLLLEGAGSSPAPPAEAGAGPGADGCISDATAGAEALQGPGPARAAFATPAQLAAAGSSSLPGEGGAAAEAAAAQLPPSSTAARLDADDATSSSNSSSDGAAGAPAPDIDDLFAEYHAMAMRLTAVPGPEAAGAESATEAATPALGGGSAAAAATADAPGQGSPRLAASSSGAEAAQPLAPAAGQLLQPAGSSGAGDDSDDAASLQLLLPTPAELLVPGSQAAEQARAALQRDRSRYSCQAPLHPLSGLHACTVGGLHACLACLTPDWPSLQWLACRSCRPPSLLHPTCCLLCAPLPSQPPQHRGQPQLVARLRPPGRLVAPQLQQAQAAALVRHRPVRAARPSQLLPGAPPPPAARSPCASTCGRSRRCHMCQPPPPPPPPPTSPLTSPSPFPPSAACAGPVRGADADVSGRHGGGGRGRALAPAAAGA
jgi:hypothetical protein